MLFPYPAAVLRDDFTPSDHDFDADEFLYAQHRYSALDLLLKDLKRLSDGLNGELLDLVNDNYAEFIGLGKLIDGVLDVVNAVQLETRRFRKQLVAVDEHLTSSQHTVGDYLLARAQLVELKTSIRLCTVLNDNVSSFQALLDREVDTKNHPVLLQHLKNLTSLYLSFAHLFEVIQESHGDTPFVSKVLRDRIMSCKFEFNAYVDEVSRVHLANRAASDIILELLNIYKITGREKSMVQLLASR